jgi:hypothetical protein
LLVTLGMCMAGCTRTSSPTSRPPDDLPPFSTQPDIHWPQPAREDVSTVVANFPSTFQPVPLPKELEKLLDPGNRPTREESDRAREVHSEVLEKDAEIDGYLLKLMSHPGLAKPAAVSKVMEDLVSLSLTDIRLIPIIAHWGQPPEEHVASWETAARLLRPPTVPETATVVAQAFQTAARNIASPAAECKALDPALIRFLVNRMVPTAATLQLRYEFSVARFEAGRSSCRVFPEKELDRLDEVQRARLRSLIGDESRSHAASEMALAYRDGCLSDKPAPAVVALGICPWATGDIGGVGLSADGAPALKPDTANAFVHHTLDAQRAAADNIPALETFLTKVANGEEGNLVDRVLGTIADQKREYWINAGKSILILTEQGAPDPDETRIRIAIVTRTGFRIAPVPISFGQYDDDSIAAIADADGDGNIEVWIRATTGECDGEEGTQAPGIDCAVESYHRLEQFGDSFIPYVEGPRPKPPKRVLPAAPQGS